MRRAAIAALLTGFFASVSPAGAACLAYGGRVEVTGTLVRVVFAGPPNYESVAHGDRPEPQFVIRLDQPQCVDAVPGIRDLILVLTPPQFAQLRPRLGTRVTLSGGLMAAETGHHHTPVMLADVMLVR